MNNNNYATLVVPFISKSYNSSKENSFKVKGKCFFIIYLKNKSIVKQFIELEKANYRATDFNMLKTHYYKQKNLVFFRDEFLKNENIFKTTKFLDLNKEQLERINHFFKYESNTTCLIQLSYLQGSNPSGSEKITKATPLKCIDKDYMSFNFYNPLKKYIDRKNKIAKNLNIDDFKKISINDLINSNVYLENFKEIFYKYNWMYINLLEDKDEIEKLNKTIKLLNNNQYKQKEIEKSYLNKVDEIYSLYINDFYNGNNEYKKQLRSIYKSWTSFLVSINKIKHISQIKYTSSEIIEAAHIIGFSLLVDSGKLDDWKLAVNGNNVIFIESNYHRLFDKNVITFNPDNKKIIVNSNSPEKKNIEMTIPLEDNFLINELSEEQLKNLKINFNYWKEHNKNIN